MGLSLRACSFVAVAASLVVGCGADGVLDLLPTGSDGGTDASGGDASDGGTQDSGALDGASGEASIDAAAEACMNGVCACGLTSCSPGCLDLANDPDHCNSCTQGCAHNQYCQQNQCHCLPMFTLCGASCFRLDSNPDHCGGCGNAPCAAGDKCENGACATGACTGGRTACDVAGRSACVDLASGSPYCGSCGVVCAPNQVCAGGQCSLYAPATPCAACPCAADCTRAVGTPASCCPGIAGGAQPICVHATVCP